jgi:hypothetical protein
MPKNLSRSSFFKQAVDSYIYALYASIVVLYDDDEHEHEKSDVF